MSERVKGRAADDDDDDEVPAGTDFDGLDDFEEGFEEEVEEEDTELREDFDFLSLGFEEEFPIFYCKQKKEEEEEIRRCIYFAGI